MNKSSQLSQNLNGNASKKKETTCRSITAVIHSLSHQFKSYTHDFQNVENIKNISFCLI